MNEASAFATDVVAMTHCGASKSLLDAGYVYVVDADLKGYFDTIPKDRLMEIVKQKISDRRVWA